MGDYTRKSQFELWLNVKEKLLFGNVIYIPDHSEDARLGG